MSQPQGLLMVTLGRCPVHGWVTDMYQDLGAGQRYCAKMISHPGYASECDKAISEVMDFIPQLAAGEFPKALTAAEIASDEVYYLLGDKVGYATAQRVQEILVESLNA